MIIPTPASLRHALTHSELSVIDYINQHESIAAELSITELAEASYTSPATVSRAIRKCGFGGIPELRRHLAAQLSTTSAPYRMNEVLALSYTECTSTIENLRIPDILRIVEYIRTARKIYILALGVTALTAEEFEFQLQLQKYTAILMADAEMMKRFDKLVEPRDLVIIFTAYNSAPAFAIAAEHARKAGCHVVTCCCKADTPLEALSDVTVVGCNLPIVKGNQFNSASRLPLQIISRTIVEYLAL